MRVKAITLGLVWFIVAVLIASLRVAHPEWISGFGTAMLVGGLLLSGLLVFRIYSDGRARHK